MSGPNWGLWARQDQDALDDDEGDSESTSASASGAQSSASASASSSDAQLVEVSSQEEQPDGAATANTIVMKNGTSQLFYPLCVYANIFGSTPRPNSVHPAGHSLGEHDGIKGVFVPDQEW